MTDQHPVLVLVLAWTAIALMIGSVVGLVTFIVQYRPFVPRLHGRGGAHLLYMSWALLTFMVSELASALLGLPLVVSIVLDVGVLVAICTVIWHRVYLHRWVERQAAETKIAASDPDGA